MPDADSEPPACQCARVLLPLKRHLKCSARSTRPIRHRRTALQAPRNRIRANADNRKASSPSLFERVWQPSCRSTSTAHLFQAYFAAKILVSRFVAKTWPAFRSLWRESGTADSRFQVGPDRDQSGFCFTRFPRNSVTLAHRAHSCLVCDSNSERRRHLFA